MRLRNGLFILLSLSGFFINVAPSRLPIGKAQRRSSKNVNRNLYKRCTLMDHTVQEHKTKKSSLDRAIHAAPSSARLENFVSKALNGTALHMLVIGGSNTAGGGIKRQDEAYYRAFAHWWNNCIEPQTGSKMTYTRVAIGGTGSDFFTFCLQNFLSKDNLPDLVLVELSVNDYGFRFGTASEPLEQLTRRVLQIASLPVVFYIDFVDRALLNDEIMNTGCRNMEVLGQRHLAEHYGITRFSLREVACPLIGKGWKRRLEDSNLFHSDGSHVSRVVHAQTLYMMSEYIKELLENEPEERPVVTAVLPEPLFSDPLVMDEELHNSICFSYLVPNWGKKLIQTLDVNITKNASFSFVSPREEKMKTGHLPFRTDAYGGWSTTSNHGVLKMRFYVPAVEQEDLLETRSGEEQLRSVSIVFRSKDNKATARAWVDEEEKAAVHMKTNFCGHHMYQTRVLPLETDVFPGFHTLTVASYGKGGEFQVCGIIVSYRGYRGFDGYRPFDVKYKVWSEKDYEKAQCKRRDS